MLSRTLHIAAATVLMAAADATHSNERLPLVLSGIVEREANGDAHAFELYGSFPDNANIRPIVSCNGKLMQAEIMAPPLVTQINVNVEAMAAGSNCTFSVQRLTDGVRSGTRTVVTTAVPIQINGIADRGVTNGRRVVELYGNFAYATKLQARVVCGARYAGGRVEFPSASQINVSMPDAGPASGCAFVLRQPGTGLASPMFGSIPAGSGAVPPSFGGYFWGGVPLGNPSSLANGQRYLNTVGFSSTRIVITPRMRQGETIHNYYNLDLAALDIACPRNTPFLPCAIRRPEYQAAISAPSLRQIVLTAYDMASSGADGMSAYYLDPAFWLSATNRAAVLSEYRDLTYALYQTQHGTGKSFVIASWEADNQAYCGSFTYWQINRVDPITTKPFREECPDGKDLATRNRAIGAITEWFKVRRDGIRAGRQLAANAGYAGVTVSDGIEFNMNTVAHTIHDGGLTTVPVVLPSMLRDVIPVVQPDYALYSSYHSQWPGTMEQDLRQLRDWLVINSPGTQLTIGEVGFPRHGLDGVHMFRTVETVKAIQRVGLPLSILWEAFDTHSDSSVRPFGLLHASGQTRSVTRILRRELQAQATEIATNPTAQILAAKDRGVTPVGGIPYRFFELYGSFPSGPFGATALCDGVETPIDVVSQSTGQINVRLLHEGVEQRYCTLRLWRADGTRSLAFGPVID